MRKEHFGSMFKIIRGKFAGFIDTFACHCNNGKKEL